MLLLFIHNVVKRVYTTTRSDKNTFTPCFDLDGVMLGLDKMDHEMHCFAAEQATSFYRSIGLRCVVKMQLM